MFQNQIYIYIYIKSDLIGNEEVRDLNRGIKKHKGSNVNFLKNNGTKVYIYKPLEQHTRGKRYYFFFYINFDPCFLNFIFCND